MPASRIRLFGFALLLAMIAWQAITNVYSKLADLQGAGLEADGWTIALEEGSSIAAWLACLALIWQLVAHVRPPRFSWPATIALHLLATVPVSLLHVGLMVAMREAGHAFSGTAYRFTGNWSASLVYEYRKDLISYAILAGFSAVMQKLARRPRASSAASAEALLEVPEGAVLHRVPIAAIDWIEAAGNYATIHWDARELLHRTTLAAMEDALQDHGFVRIHRSRIVRRAAVRKVETAQSGDFTVTLAEGTVLRGSRRYRERLRH